MDKTRKNILLTFICFLILNIIIFSIVAYLNWTLLTGFLIGVALSCISYFINEVYLLKLLGRKRNFKISFTLGFFKQFLWIVIFVAIFVGIIFANKNFNNSWTNGIFNIFSFMYGFSTIGLSIIIFNFIEICYSGKINKEKRSK